MSGLAFPKPVRAEKTRPERKRRPPRRLDDPAKSDPQYLAHVHNSEECVGVRAFPGHRCRRGFHASHFRNHTGASLKESDRLTVKMCGELHLEHWERYAGPFKGWSQEERKGWFLERVRETHRRFVAEHPERAADFYPAVIL